MTMLVKEGMLAPAFYTSRVRSASTGSVGCAVKGGERKNERTYKEGIFEKIGYAVGIQAYKGQGYDGGMPGVRVRNYIPGATSSM